MQVPTCAPPHLQRRPRRRKTDCDPAAPVTFAPGAPQLRSRPPDPGAPPAPSAQEGPGGRRHRGPPTILPGAPRCSPARPSAQETWLPPAQLQPLCPRPQLPGHPPGEGRRRGGDRSGRRNYNSRRAPTRQGADRTQAPPLPSADALAGGGAGVPARPAPTPTPRGMGPRGPTLLRPALPTSPDVHCAAQGPSVPSHRSLSPTNPNEHRAAREPTEPMSTPLKGPLLLLGRVFGDGVRERGSGGSGRSGAGPGPCPCPRGGPAVCEGMRGSRLSVHSSPSGTGEPDPARAASGTSR